jgi:hypothetical protein
VNRKKAEGKKTRSKKIDMSKIEVARKDAIVNGVHERIRTFREKRTFVPKERATELKTWLEQQPEVESVSLYGDSDLTVKFKDKTQVGILLNRKNMYGGSGPEGEIRVVTGVSRRNILTPEGDPHPVSKKACVIDTLYDDWAPKSTPDNIVSMLTNAGYEVDFIKSNDANLNFFTTLDNNEYGVVFIRSHGGMMNVGGDNKVQIMVRPFFTNLPPTSGYTGVEVLTVNTDVVSQGWAYVYSFNNLFVNAYMNNKYFPNTLFHLLVCHGADPDAQNDMIQSLLNRGAGCYTGWTKNASPTHGDPAAVQFFQVLCQTTANPTNMVTNAISQITSSGHSPDPGTTEVLVSQGASTMQIIRCFIIDEASQIAIQDSAGKVIRKGFHDVMDAAQFAHNQIIGGKHNKLKITQTIRLEKVQW